MLGVCHEKLVREEKACEERLVKNSVQEGR